MSIVDRSFHRRNGTATSRRSGLALVPEDHSSAMVISATTPPTNSAGRSRRKSRSPASMRSRTDSSTITTALGLGKKRKSTASSSSGAAGSVYGTDDMAVDRGRNPKTKLKPKVQSRYAAENTTSMEQQSQQQPHSHRFSRKERSKSHESRERTKKQPLSDTSTGEKITNIQQLDIVGSSSISELARVKKEIEMLKKVRRL